jgi:streptogrisin C
MQIVGLLPGRCDQQMVVIMRRAKFVSRINRARRRFGRGGVAAGVAVVVVAATGVAFAGDGGSSSPRHVLAMPKVDAEGAYGLAVRYLVGRGLSPERARQRMANQSVALKAVTELRRRAPGGVGSVWLDEGGNLKVRVLDDVGKREATAVGATPVFGKRATADVEAARDALADDVMRNPPAGLSGAIFEIDDAADRVVARYFFEKSGGVVPEAATELGGLVMASVDVASIRPQADVRVAGARMDSESLAGYCTAGWAVDIPVADGGVPKNGVLTAGHCFDNDFDPRQTKYSIDTMSEGDTPATGMFVVLDERGDYGVLELGNGDRGRTTMADTFHVVEAVQEPVVGAVVCKDGVRTAQTCGEILRVDISIIGGFRPGGPRILVRGLTRVGYCGELGDSGAPVFAEFDEGKSIFAVAAIGIHSGDVGYTDAEGKRVCGEKVNEPNEAFFTPVSGMDTEGKFFIRIDGG